MGDHRSRILLVEDDPKLAGQMVKLLRDADYEVDGPYASVSDGMAALATRFPDGAIVDLHHPSDAADLLKEDLEAYDIPFLDREDTASPRGRLAPLEARLLPWLRHVRH